MIKISALNAESEDDSESEEEVTREALEQIAKQQYAKALDLHRKGKLSDATQLLKDLLDTELLYNVKKPEPGEKVTDPLLNLKYLCYKNLASMLGSCGDVDDAIEAYYSASKLDDTDLTLWHRLGMLCMRAKRYERALDSFQRGLTCNPKHWPCLDKIITILLGLDCNEQCIVYIHDALQLDPGYLRGLAYRKHLYSVYHHLRDYMEHKNPIYKWNPNDDEPIDNDEAEKLIKEAEEIHESHIEEQKAQEIKSFIPHLKLKHPITSFTWDSVGESLIHMHNFMTENYFSYACPLELVYEREELMEVCEEMKEGSPESKPEDSVTDSEKQLNPTSSSENDNNISDKDKAATDTEKVESDMEVVPPELPTQTAQDKKPVRRRACTVSALKQWNWCTTKARKKPNNIYDILRNMIPVHLSPDIIERKEKNKEKASSPNVTYVNELFEDKEIGNEKGVAEYFGTEDERKDVKMFINKYNEEKTDIINMFSDFLLTLAQKWQYKWSENLCNKFVEANNCYNNYVDVPSPIDEDRDRLVHYVNVNILVEELQLNKLLHTPKKYPDTCNANILQLINLVLNMNPQIFSGVDCMEMSLRYQWLKLHTHILEKNNELALDCLYQLLNEFEMMGEHKEEYSLNVTNFTFKPKIVHQEIVASIKFFERNKKLDTVLELYENQNYEEVLSIVIESFEYCKTISKEEEDEMVLEFAAQLSLILDTFWALGKTDDCFKWAFTCLHEALKHYFRYTSSSPEYEKWTKAVMKILLCMEHILKVEGLSCLDSISSKELSQGLEDLIRIIGHQVETKASEMPFRTVSPWIIMHYILQKLEDLQSMSKEDIPNPLKILFLAHEQLGNRNWCMNCDGKLLTFTLDIVTPLLRAPALSKYLDQITQYMEQCVYCLFSARKGKLKYLSDHKAKGLTLNWEFSQKVYEVLRPAILPGLEGKVAGITMETETMFTRILALIPEDMDPQNYVPEIKRYVDGFTDLLPKHSLLLPHKMRDIYFLLGDYQFKTKKDNEKAIKYNMLDLVVNNDRLESWGQISLCKTQILNDLLNSCRNIDNDREYLLPAKSVIRCYKRSLELDPSLNYLWMEYGIFVYTVHSFCSRVLKQASESLSMENFASLEKQKEDMLDTTLKCFSTVMKKINSCNETEELWLKYYMLGKVAEKRNNAPAVYLNYYSQAVKSLQESDAVYHSKISSSTHLGHEVLELHYRIHASILKYIEQHENKPIPASVGKVFSTCIQQWKNCQFSKKSKKDNPEIDNETQTGESVHAANILKRSISDAGEDESVETKRKKLESAAAKVRRSASYDTERIATNKDPITSPKKSIETVEPLQNIDIDTSLKETTITNLEQKTDGNSSITTAIPETSSIMNVDADKPENAVSSSKTSDETQQTIDKNVTEPEPEPVKKNTSSSSSSSSSSDSSSSDSSDSSSDSSTSSEGSTNTTNENTFLSEEEIMCIIRDCLEALEDCASRFTPHYKAIYRLAHYHFYYKKGKNIERCRDLMLSMFTSLSGQKQAGQKRNNKSNNTPQNKQNKHLFHNIWKIPISDVDRGGGFAFHMNRATLLTMEILKEIDDHETLLELSLYLQKIPDPGKNYLRECDREELAQQAFSLCIQSLKGQLMLFSQQEDLKSNDVERQALKSLMNDIYNGYRRVQKSSKHVKQFTNLLVDAYKLMTTTPLTDGMNLVDLSLKYCYTMQQTMNQKAIQSSIEKSQNAQKKQAAKAAETLKVTATPAVSSIVTQTKPDVTKTDKTLISSAPITSFAPPASTSKPSTHHQDLATSFHNLTSQQTAALYNFTAMANLSSLQNPLQNSFQAEFYRQFLNQALSAFMPPLMKQKAPKTSSSYKTSSSSSVAKSASASFSKPALQSKPSSSTSSFTSKPALHSSALKASTSQTKSHGSLHKSVSHSTSIKPSVSHSGQLKSSVSLSHLPSSGYGKYSKSFSASTTVTKATPTPVISSLQKSASTPLGMGTVLPSLPASLTNLSTFGSSHSSASAPQAHMSTSSTVNAAIHTKPPMPHQQVSPGKTLQEKLAERQKSMPKGSQDFGASLSRLPSSLMITKTGSSKSMQPNKKSDAKKTLTFGDKEVRPQPVTSGEVIILDDD